MDWPSSPTAEDSWALDDEQQLRSNLISQLAQMPFYEKPKPSVSVQENCFLGSMYFIPGVDSSARFDESGLPLKNARRLHRPITIARSNTAPTRRTKPGGSISSIEQLLEEGGIREISPLRIKKLSSSTFYYTEGGGNDEGNDATQRACEKRGGDVEVAEITPEQVLESLESLRNLNCSDDDSSLSSPTNSSEDGMWMDEIPELDDNTGSETSHYEGSEGYESDKSAESDETDENEDDEPLGLEYHAFVLQSSTPTMRSYHSRTSSNNVTTTSATASATASASGNSSSSNSSSSNSSTSNSSPSTSNRSSRYSISSTSSRGESPTKSIFSKVARSLTIKTKTEGPRKLAVRNSFDSDSSTSPGISPIQRRPSHESLAAVRYRKTHVSKAHKILGAGTS